MYTPAEAGFPVAPERLTTSLWLIHSFSATTRGQTAFWSHAIPEPVMGSIALHPFGFNLLDLYDIAWKLVLPRGP